MLGGWNEGVRRKSGSGDPATPNTDRPEQSWKAKSLLFRV